MLGFENFKALEQLANTPAKGYRVFDANKGGTKPRFVQEPIGQRKRAHVRLFNILQRIAVPDYLHSGVKGRSSITNASAHLGHHSLFKTDIKRFYENIGTSLIIRGFREEFQCASDVAAVLGKLCSAQGHVPTGSSLSQFIAFYAIKRHLDEFWLLCARRAVTCTLYVDDVTISGDGASKKLIFALKKSLAKDRLVCHKDAAYRARDAKTVTGVVLLGDKKRVPNKHHRKLRDTVRELLGTDPNTITKSDIDRIRGRVASARQIEPNFRFRTEFMNIG